MTPFSLATTESVIPPRAMAYSNTFTVMKVTTHCMVVTVLAMSSCGEEKETIASLEVLILQLDRCSTETKETTSYIPAPVFMERQQSTAARVMTRSTLGC